MTGTQQKRLVNVSEWALIVGVIVTIACSVLSVVQHWSDSAVSSPLADIALGAIPFALLTITIFSLLRCREAKKALNESESNYRDLADSLQETIFEMDLQGNLIWVNKAAFEVFGYGFDAFVPGKLHALDMVIEEDRDRGFQSIKRILGGEDVGLSEYTCLRKSGTTFPALFSTNLIKDRNGNPQGLRGLVIDISHRKNAEKLMREEADRVNRWFEELNEGAYVSSLDGKLLNANASAAGLIGYDDPNAMIGMDVRTTYVEPKQREDLIAEIKEHGFIRNRIIDIRKKDGTTTQLATTAYLNSGKLFGRLAALEEIAVEQLIPICSVMECRKIRDESGQWHRFEEYFTKKFDYKFSHSICPSCAQLLYPDKDLD